VLRSGSSPALLAAFAGAGAFIALHLRDAPPPDDADLVAIRSAPEPNADGMLLESIAALDRSPEVETKLEKAMLHGDYDGHLYASIAAAQNRALALLESAVVLDDFAAPPMRTIDDDLSYLSAWRELARAAAMRAIARARSGETSGAFSDALLPIRLGRLLSRDPNAVMFHAIVALTLKRIGTETIEDVLALVEPTPEDSLQWSRTVEAMRTDPAAWSAWHAAEYRVMKPTFAALDLVDEEGLPAPLAARFLPERYAIHPNATLQRFAAWTRVEQSLASRPCRTLPAPDFLPRGVRALEAEIRPNAVGEEALRRATGAYHYAELRRCRSETDLSATQALIALRAFQAEHGALPRTLDELVPRYLDAIPLDAYDGEPLRYDPEAKRLRSVGARHEIERPSWDTSDFALRPAYAIPF
jgi:hypothetical protein